jgi:hypothetical protein
LPGIPFQSITESSIPAGPPGIEIFRFKFYRLGFQPQAVEQFQAVELNLTAMGFNLNFTFAPFGFDGD